MSEPALRLDNVSRCFELGGGRLEVLRGVSMALDPGELVALVGPSGAGKSTLLQVAGLLEPPDGGEVHIDGAPCGNLSDGERTRLRRDTLGFVYQFHHLLPAFSALENVMLPRLIAGESKTSARGRASELLAQLGLEARADHRPARLSGGEQQRVALARALANRPRLLLADEPPGNLDHGTAMNVFDSLTALVRETGVAALVATHNMELAGKMDRVLALEDGIVTIQ